MDSNVKIDNLSQIVEYAAKTFSTACAYKWVYKKEVMEKSFVDVHNDTMAVSRFIDKLDMDNKHVAIIGTSSYEWITAYFGIVGANGVAVPIDPLLPAADICTLLERADVETLIFDEIRADVVALVKEKCSKIKNIISMQGKMEGVASFWEMVENNRGQFKAEIDSNQLCTILFTSGTTGVSKGVMLSHRNLADNATCFEMKIKPGTVGFSVLPINHVFCLTMDVVKGLYCGVCLCINDSIMHIQKNLKLFKPEIALMVPMMIQSIYKKLKAVNPVIPKKLIAKKALGGNLKTIYSGGAYLDQEYIDAFKEYGVDILQGYGMSECSPVISTSTQWDVVPKSVGTLIPNCEGKIVDDEIWVRGSSVMMGYYKMPEETKETITEDGWLKTGDLGYIDEKGHVFITGRKKNLIILSNGENVSPEEIENILEKENLIGEVMVRASEGLIEAVIFPDYEYAKAKKISDINSELQAVIDRINKEQPVYKRVQKITVRDTEFEKTTSKKIKRY